MAQPARNPVFLQRAGYRQRRWRDVARMIPVAALVLWLLPLAWSGGEGGTASALVYIFVVWGLLILVSAVVSVLIGSSEDEPPQGDGTGRS